jgi:hypothetical protein
MYEHDEVDLGYDPDFDDEEDFDEEDFDGEGFDDDSSLSAMGSLDSSSVGLLGGIKPELASRVRSMAGALAARGIKIRVVSGLRSTAKQAALYANRGNSSLPVAKPGTSKHERGEAVDVAIVGKASPKLWAVVGEEGERVGLRWGGRFNRPDPVHFELSGGSMSAASNAAVRVGQVAVRAAAMGGGDDNLPRLVLGGVLGLVVGALIHKSRRR